MKTLAAIIIATATTTSPQNAPQRAINTSTTVPIVLQYDAQPVDKDALSLRIFANTPIACFLRIKKPNPLENNLPVLVHVGGMQPVLIDQDNYIEKPIIESNALRRELRVKIVPKGGRLPNINNYDIACHSVGY
jgi:hypothetical protein